MNHILIKGRRIPKWFSYLFIGLFVFILFISSALAGGLYKQWSNVEIRHPIRVDGAVNSGLTVNITVKDPDNKVVTNFAPMLRDLTSEEHVYNLSGGKTGELGIYTYCITTTSTSLNDTSCFDFEVTPSGDKGLLGYYILIISLSYGVIIFGVAHRDITISILGTFGLFFVGLWILYFGLDVFKNYLTNGFAIITLGIASYVSVRLTHEYIVD